MEEDPKFLQPMGNEAANFELPDRISLGANSGNILNLDENFGQEENIINIINNVPKGSEGKNGQADNEVKNASAPVIQPPVNAPAQQQEEKPEFYVDSENPYAELEDPDHPLNKDLVVENPRLKKRKGKKKSSKSKKSGNNINIVNQDMEPAAGWNFNAQKLPARKHAGWFRRFLSATSYYAGQTIGKAINYLGNLIYVSFSFSLGKLWRSRTGRTDNPKVTQETRDHETIPGWNGEKYDKSGDQANDVIADFRRVPTVWPRLTALQAENSEGKPLPPKVGVYVSQPKEGEDKDVNWTSFGHSGIGIEYSRYSRQTQRYERYSLRYGFYQSGATISGGILTNSSNVIVPGTLADENDSGYTVSRKFTATSRQVNDILRASETWADKGYNASSRNCTTFVKEMVRDVAHLPLSNDIFTEDHLRLSSLGNFVYFGSTASSLNARMGMESQFDKLGQQEDMSYSGFGNKRFTKQDYRQYKETLGKGVNWVTTADTPNSAAENMRRLEGKYAGTLGSWEFSGSIPKTADGTLLRTYANVEDAVNAEGKKVAGLIMTLSGKTEAELSAMFKDAQAVVELFNILQNGGTGSPIEEAAVAGGDPDTLRAARKHAEEEIELLNKVLSEYFQNDKRLHIPVVNVISILNHGIEMIDNDYNNALMRQRSDRELGNIRGGMESNAYQLIVGDHEAIITPSHYESYIQIYKTADEAIKNYARFKELQEIDNDPHQTLSKEEKREYLKLKRIDKLADQFDLSHRYMLEKDSYSQQDLDYAFSLSKKEAAEGEAQGAMINRNATSSGIYQALIYEKIFGGMKQRYLNHIKTKEQGEDMDTVNAWLENDLLSCINRKRDEFTAVIRAISRNLDQKEFDLLAYDFQHSMAFHWFEKIFTQGDNNGPLSRGPNIIIDALGELLGDDQSQFKTQMKGISKYIFAEGDTAQPDSIQKIRKKK